MRGVIKVVRFECLLPTKAKFSDETLMSHETFFILSSTKHRAASQRSKNSSKAREKINPNQRNDIMIKLCFFDNFLLIRNRDAEK